MDGKPKECRLPYVNGGTPGALFAFTCAEAILGLIICAASVISSVVSLSSGGGSISLVSIPLSVYSVILSFRAFLGLKKLRRDDCSGASDVAGVCRKRIILIWVLFSLAVIIELASVLGSRMYVGASLLGVLLGAGLSLLFILPLVFYYSDAEKTMNHIADEGFSGKAVLPMELGRLPVMCIIFAALLLLFSALFVVGVIPMSYELRSFVAVIGLFLYLSGARYLLVCLCYRGFNRAHALLRTDENASFTPAGYSDAPAFCVLGSVFFGWFAFEAVCSFIGYAAISGYLKYYSFLDIFTNLIAIASYILLALALMRRPGRGILSLIGGGGLLLRSIYCLINAVGISYGSDLYRIMAPARWAILLLFWLIFIISTVIRIRGKKVPRTLRIIMIVIAALCVTAELTCTLSLTVSVYTIFDIMGTGIYLAALLALVRMLRIPGVPEGDGKEKEETTFPGVPEGGEALQPAEYSEPDGK